MKILLFVVMIFAKFFSFFFIVWSTILITARNSGRSNYLKETIRKLT